MTFGFLQGQALVRILQKRGMIVFNCIDELHQGLDDHWSKIRPEMKSVMARLRIFSQPGAPVVAMSATVTEEEVTSMVKNLGLREKPVILRASPVQDHHKYVVIKRPPNIQGCPFRFPYGGGLVPPHRGGPMGGDKGPMGGDWRVIRDKSGR